MQTHSNNTLIRISEVQKITGLCRTAIYNAMEDGGFPAQVKIGLRASAWVAAEVYDWVESRIAERQKAGG